MLSDIKQHYVVRGSETRMPQAAKPSRAKSIATTETSTVFSKADLEEGQATGGGGRHAWKSSGSYMPPVAVRLTA